MKLKNTLSKASNFSTISFCGLLIITIFILTICMLCGANLSTHHSEPIAVLFNLSLTSTKEIMLLLSASFGACLFLSMPLVFSFFILKSTETEIKRFNILTSVNIAMCSIFIIVFILLSHFNPLTVSFKVIAWISVPILVCIMGGYITSLFIDKVIKK